MDNSPPNKAPNEKSGVDVAASGASSRRRANASRDRTSGSIAVQNPPEIETGTSMEGLLEPRPAQVNPSGDGAQPTECNDQVADLDSTHWARNKQRHKESKRKRRLLFNSHSSPTTTLSHSGAISLDSSPAPVPPQTTSNHSIQDRVIESGVRPGAFAVHGVEESNDGGTVQIGGETETVVVSADLVDTTIEEQLRQRLSETEAERERLEAERNQIVDAEEVRVDNNETGANEGKDRIVRWATAFVVLLVVVLAIILGVVFGRRGKSPDLDELVALFSNTSPATATALKNKTDNQYQAMEWLAKDVEENGFGLITGVDQILARGALAILFYSTNGDGWDEGAKTGWLDHGVSECTWASVECTSGIVTKLDLGYPGNNLVGTLPREIHLLSTLEYLDVGWNSISGTIPTEIARLTNLRTLGLSYNKFTGTLPSEFGLLTNLEYLDVSSNSIGGTIPTEIGRLSNLRRNLRLYENQFTGTLPSEFGLLKNLEVLSVGGNSISGTIATEIGRLRNLRELYLWYNQFTGMLPSEFGLLTNLEYLNVETNSLSGTVPTELGELKKLETLWLFHNEFTGQVPSQVCAIDSLIGLYADCGGSQPEIECTCCTGCCPDPDNWRCD